MSLLSSIQKEAIGIIFPQEMWWKPSDLSFLRESGWYDYLLARGDVDDFPPDLYKSPVTLDGRLYIKLSGDYDSIFVGRFFAIENTVPVQLVVSKRGSGYDYLLPANTLMQLTYNTPYEKRYTLDRQEVDSLVSAAKYGINMDVVALTGENGTTKLALWPLAGTSPPVAVLNNIINKIVFPTYQQYKDVIFDDHKDKYMYINPLKISPVQYNLPNPDDANLELARDLINRTSVSDHTYGLEIVMSLASKGLLNQYDPRLDESHIGRLIKIFARNIQRFGYLRYPLWMMSNVYPPLAEYQNFYSKVDKSGKLFLSGFGYSSSPDLKQSYLARRNRLSDLYNKRIKKILDATGMKLQPDDVAIVHFSQVPSTWVSVEIEGRGMYGYHWVNEELKSRLIAMEEDRKSLSKSQDTRTLELSNVPTGVATMHGIVFSSFELSRIFHNTPLSSAIELGISEIDSAWLSHRDVKLIKQLLQGLIMPYAFANEISDSAFEVMSDRDTFIYLYHLKGAGEEIDRAFVLGVPMMEYLSDLKDKPGLSNPTMTFLSLIP